MDKIFIKLRQQVAKLVNFLLVKNFQLHVYYTVQWEIFDGFKVGVKINN